MFRVFFSLGVAAFALLFKGCSLPAGMRSGYAVEEDKVVHYAGFPARRVVIEEAQVEAFVALNDDYGKDDRHVFLREKIIPGADPNTFVFLGGSYSKDKNHGYTRERVISNDAAHFSIVANPNDTPNSVSAEGIVYARDSRYVYEGTVKINNADPATFEFVPMFNGYYVCRDKKHVYWQHRPLAGIDGQSFVKVTPFHFKDKNSVWALSLGRDTQWVQLPEADAATFVGLKKHYAKDRAHVYCETVIVEGADPATFEETENRSGKDKNGLYQSGAKLK